MLEEYRNQRKEREGEKHKYRVCLRRLLPRPIGFPLVVCFSVFREDEENNLSIYINFTKHSIILTNKFFTILQFSIG